MPESGCEGYSPWSYTMLRFDWDRRMRFTGLWLSADQADQFGVPVHLQGEAIRGSGFLVIIRNEKTTPRDPDFEAYLAPWLAADEDADTRPNPAGMIRLTGLWKEQQRLPDGREVLAGRMVKNEIALVVVKHHHKPAAESPDYSAFLCPVLEQPSQDFATLE
jgi:hypothetical protein